MFYSISLILLIFIIIILFILMILTIIKNKKYPYCGGYLNLKLIPKCKANDCKDDQQKESDFSINLIIVIKLLLEIYKNTPDSFINNVQSFYPNAQIYKGIFYFAPPELLKILPSDFGQNNSTPYGIISFFNTYLSCISDIEEFCHSNLMNSPQLELICNLLKKFKTQECPFVVNDGNTNLYIPDKKFFNNIGLLGAFSINYQQAILLKVRLPVKDLNLNYWSLNVYMADNLDPDLTCHPYLNLSVASLVPSLNMYTGTGISGKKFNPITGEGDLLEKGYINFLVIICLNKTIADNIQYFFKSQFDFVHAFEVPTAVGSMPIDPNLPNPNDLNNQSTLFNPFNQRLTMFMRLSPDPGTDNLKTFNKFISDTSGKYFQTVLVAFNEKDFPIIQYKNINLPQMINPSVNEYDKIEDFKDITSIIKNNIFLTFRKKQLKLRNSTLNIFGPQFKDVFNTLHNYQGGWQGIQLGGNAQGDNYDAQYRLSESTCLQKTDVMVAVCVNHSYYDNSLYNSINLVDLNRGYGVIAFNFNNNFNFPYYIILFGRDMESINIIEKKINSNQSSDLKIYKYYIDSNEIPVCDHLLMVERIYININYQSLDKKNIYSLHNLFGKDLKNLNLNEPDDKWNSLINVAAPNLSYLIPPVYYLISPISNTRYYIFGIILTFLILLLIIIYHFKT